MGTIKNLNLVQGKTLALAVRWEIPPVVYKPITAMLQKTPVRFTVTGHGMPDGWRVALTGIVGPKELNAPDPNKLRDSDYHEATVIDANTIELNTLNAAGLRDYVSGGTLQYNTPKELTGFEARMSIKTILGEEQLLVCTADGTSGTTKPSGAGTDGTAVWEETTTGTPLREWQAERAYTAGDVIDLKELYRLSTDNGRLVVDDLLYTITLVFSAADTANMTWRTGRYDLEMISPDSDPVIPDFLQGTVTVSKEATTK